MSCYRTVTIQLLRLHLGEEFRHAEGVAGGEVGHPEVNGAEGFGCLVGEASASGCDNGANGTPIGGVRLALEQAAFGEAIDDVGHGRRVEEGGTLQVPQAHCPFRGADEQSEGLITGHRAMPVHAEQLAEDVTDSSGLIERGLQVGE